MTYKPLSVDNARHYLPAPLLRRCLKALKGKASRRITFRADRTTTTMELLPAPVRAECLQALMAHLPVRLYFSNRTKKSGRPPHPLRDDAFRLVASGHRLEAVALYIGTARQTLSNWGLRQPPRDQQHKPRPDDLAALKELGLARVAEKVGIDPTLDALAAKLSVRVATAHHVAVMVGLIVRTEGTS